jgi:hypothetical protein
MCKIVFGAVVLFEQDLLRATVPDASPVFIGPTEAERKLRFTRRKNLREGAFENAASVKPVVVIAETMDPILSGEFGLGFPYVGQPEVIETKICRSMRLLMSREKRSGLRNVAPLCEPLAPPCVVFRDWVELRKVKGNRSEVRLILFRRLLHAHMRLIPRASLLRERELGQ